LRVNQKRLNALAVHRRVFLCQLNRKIKLIIEYEGTAYQGWQLQASGPTIQGRLQETLKRITGETMAVVGSGRTDSGVHAEAQVAHFRTASRMTPRQFLMAFNSVLPRDIVITRVEEPGMDFHAQMSAVGKVYRYTLLNRRYPSALHYRRCTFLQAPLDEKAMERAAAMLVGEHDFSAFRAGNCQAKSPIRKIFHFEMYRVGDIVEMFFEGNGFLKHMIRNIVGTLILVGRGKIPVSDMVRILASRDRGQAGPTAPPQGLTLVRVYYPGEPREELPMSPAARAAAGNSL